MHGRVQCAKCTKLHKSSAQHHTAQQIGAPPPGTTPPPGTDAQHHTTDRQQIDTASQHHTTTRHRRPAHHHSPAADRHRRPAPHHHPAQHHHTAPPPSTTPPHSTRRQIGTTAARSGTETTEFIIYIIRGRASRRYNVRAARVGSARVRVRVAGSEAQKFGRYEKFFSISVGAEQKKWG